MFGVLIEHSQTTANSHREGTHTIPPSTPELPPKLQMSRPLQRTLPHALTSVWRASGRRLGPMVDACPRASIRRSKQRYRVLLLGLTAKACSVKKNALPPSSLSSHLISYRLIVALVLLFLYRSIAPSDCTKPISCRAAPGSKYVVRRAIRYWRRITGLEEHLQHLSWHCYRHSRWAVVSLPKVTCQGGAAKLELR